MGRSLFKLTRARVLALSVGLGLAGSLASAPASMAATQQPAVGTNCQADGHINGAGSTFQTQLQQDAFAYGFEQDVCGPAPTASNLYQGGTIGSQTAATNSYGTPGGSMDPSLYSFTVAGSSTSNPVNSMVAYNYKLNNVAAKNGSGAGLERMGCRTDMFAGTDLPYNTTQLTNMDGAPGAGQTCSAYVDTTGWNPDQVPPPYGPQDYGNWGSTADGATAKAMAFPVAAGAVAFVANLTGPAVAASGQTPATGGCTITPNSPADPNYGVSTDTLNLTPLEMDDIWQGTINQWNDSVLDANNPWLYEDGCSGPIQRVVRQDNSGTTAITQFTLQAYLNIDGNTGLCSTPTGTGGSPSWYLNAIASSNAGLWPSGCTDSDDYITDSSGDVSSTPLNTAAPNTTNGGTSGSPALIDTVLGTTADPQSGSGDIGYAELGLWPTQPSSPVQTGDVYVDLATPATQTSATPTYIGPSANPAVPSQSNCQLQSTVPTGNSATAAVGLATTTWTNSPAGDTAVLNPVVGKQDVADPSGGTGYAACGLTFDLVYNKQNQTGETAPVTGASLTTNSSSVAKITNDQQRTLYSYFTYVLSPLGQDQTSLGASNNNVQNQTLDPVPSSWLPFLEQGFQANF